MNYTPKYLQEPTMQDVCYEMREPIKALHRALNRERDYREAKRPFDAHEVVIAVEDCVRALSEKARAMREMMRIETSVDKLRGHRELDDIERHSRK